MWPIGPLRGIMLFMGGAGFAIGWSVRRRSTAEIHDRPLQRRRRPQPR